MLKSLLPDLELGELVELCASAPDGGSICELGSYRGGSAYAFNKVARGRKLHLFDTFTGIPEQSPGDVFGIGAFGDTDVEAIRRELPDAILHIGMFPGTMPADLGPISFAFIDCDQYVSCKAAIDLWSPLVLPGGIIAFDDYPFEGIKRAIHDAFGNRVQFTKSNMAYVVRP